MKKGRCYLCGKRGTSRNPLTVHHYWFPKAEILARHTRSEAAALRRKKFLVHKNEHRAFHLKAIKCRDDYRNRACRECRYAPICRYWVLG